MSELNDKLFELDKKKNNTISMALERHASENDGARNGQRKEPAIPASPVKYGNTSWIWMLVMTVLMAITVAVVVLFAGATVHKMQDVRNSGDQLAVLLEEHIDNFNRLKDHVAAMEGEFRRAFEKDRAEAITQNNAVVQRFSDMQADMNAVEARLREEMLKYKSQVVDGQSAMSKIDREYEQLNKEFQSIKEQFIAVQAKLLEMTVE
ncbi:MAG TPA: hypothetical protein VLJ10_06120 [Candidatus Bathyarchaeia archaeon]|nr:hypothetical protein [Candidatus Bathyarchaeia archaeon]